MKLLRIAAFAVLALSGAACATTDGPGTGTPPPVMKGVQAVLTTYADIFQPLILAYGHLPRCPAAALCGDQAVVDKLKAADAKAVATILAVRPILSGAQPDGGQVAAALAAVTDAERQVAASGAMQLK